MGKHLRFNNGGNTECIIEFQSFIGSSDEFIVKELVVMDINTNVLNYFLFKPPHSFQKLTPKAKRINKWLMNNFHHIAWSEGFTDYNELQNIITHYTQQYGIIYTTGFKKRKWIEQYTTNKVINYVISKHYQVNTGSGFCNSVNKDEHRISNCCLIKAYRLLSAMGKLNENSQRENHIK